MLADVPHVPTYDKAAAAAAMRDAEVILQWSGTRDMLSEAFAGCPALRWIHSRYAGVDSYLFPELVNGDVVLTNARGVYSPSLGEFVLAAMLYFAKDIPRLRRDQAAGRWAPFEMEMIAWADSRHRGLRRHWAGGGFAGARHGNEGSGDEAAPSRKA